MKTRVGLIAMDMDGTLLDAKQRIPEENANAIREAQAKGIHIALCSGRTAGDISCFIRSAGLGSCATLALNGACNVAEPFGKPYDVCLFKPGTAREIINILQARMLTFACFQVKRVIANHTPPGFPQTTWGMHIGQEGAEAYEYGEEALARYGKEGICKIVYIDAERNTERIARVRGELIKIRGLSITSSWADNLELMPEGVGKDVALMNLAARLGIPRERVMAIGDFDNDLAMIRAAGIGVAMGNASETVKAAAKHVTLSNVECGVAEAIRRYAL